MTHQGDVAPDECIHGMLVGTCAYCSGSWRREQDELEEDQRQMFIRMARARNAHPSARAPQGGKNPALYDQRFAPRRDDQRGGQTYVDPGSQPAPRPFPRTRPGALLIAVPRPDHGKRR